MKTLKITAQQNINIAGNESLPQENGFQPSAQLDADSFESKMSEPDKKEQKLAATSVASKIPEEVAYHERALVYLEKLGEKIKAEHGQEKLDELYEQVDKFQSTLAGIPIFASGVKGQLGICAEEEARAEKQGKDVDFAILVFLCFSEETFHNIFSIFHKQDCYQRVLSEYIAGINFAYDSLGIEGQELIGDLYEQYITGDHSQEF